MEASIEPDEHNTDHIEVVSVEVVNIENDESIASADEIVPEVSHSPQLNLNCCV